MNMRKPLGSIEFVVSHDDTEKTWHLQIVETNETAPTIERSIIDKIWCALLSILHSSEFKLWIATSALSAIVLILYSELVTERSRIGEARVRHLTEIDGRVQQWYSVWSRDANRNCFVARRNINLLPIFDSGTSVSYVPFVILGEFKEDSLTSVVDGLSLLGVSVDDRLLRIKSSILFNEPGCEDFIDDVSSYVGQIRSRGSRAAFDVVCFHYIPW